jgi:Protein of unknown function (DUF4242)
MARLWMIERDFTGSSDDELEAAGLRAKLCATWYPEMEWVRSFYDREAQRTLCYYWADSEEDIRTHAASSGIPCGRVTPVEEILPTDLSEPTAEMAAAYEHALPPGLAPAMRVKTAPAPA